jgi:hypothetical protein
MNRLFLPIFVFLTLAGGLGRLGALELEVIGGLNGLTFNPEKTDAYTESGTDNEFTPYLYKLANLSIRHDFSEILGICVNIERDNLLQNSVNAVLGAKTDYFCIKFGPFLGLTDNFHRPDAGITGNLELIIPGIVFLSISGSSTLGSQYEYTSNNYRETGGIELGFWLENAIPSLSASTKRLSRRIQDTLVVDDSLLRLLFNLDFFTKNSNISGYINGGYQIYSRVYTKGGLEFRDELGISFVGFGLNWQIIRPLGVKIGFEMPFTFSAVEPMTVTPEFWLLYKAYAGFVYSFDR